MMNLRLYLILDAGLCGGVDGMVNTAVTAVQNGVTMVQFRSETMSKRRFYDAAMLLKRALAPFSVPLIINDHVDVALAVDADGVHVGQGDLPSEVVRELIGRQKIVGLSVSNEEELGHVNLDVVDYVGLGPVFPTASKSFTPDELGLITLTALASKKRCPAVAIGGIKANNATRVMRSGVDGISVISAICGQPDVARATADLLHAIDVVECFS
jgi:thiamine-phosphate pyrophosphorylase